MVKKTLVSITLAAGLLCAPGPLLAEEPLRLDALLAEAESNSPELAAMRARYEAARERIPQAGAFEDPMLTLGFINVPVDSFRFDKDEMTGKMVEVSQMLPFFGKRALRKEAAGHEALAFEAEYRERMLAHHAEIKEVYYDLYAIRKSLEVVEKNVWLMEAFKKTAEAKYSVGKGMLRDIVKAQVEVSMLIDRRLGLEKEDRTKRAFLGSLLGREAPVMGPVEDITLTEVKLDRETLAEAAKGGRPAILAAEEKVRQGSAKVDLARKESYPDFTIAATYMQRDTLDDGMELSDMLSATVSINVPVWWGSKLRPMAREAVSERAMAEKEKDALTREIYYRIDSLAYEVEQDDRLLRLYKDNLIPQGTEDMDSALAGYEVGRSDFLDLLESRRTLFDFELGYYMTLAEREKALAELEAVVGVEFK